MSCSCCEVLSASYLFFFICTMHRGISYIRSGTRSSSKRQNNSCNNFFTFLITRNWRFRRMEEINIVSDTFRLDVKFLRINISHCFRATSPWKCEYYTAHCPFFSLSAFKNNLTRIFHYFSTVTRKMAGAVSQKPIAPNNYVIYSISRKLGSVFFFF